MKAIALLLGPLALVYPLLIWYGKDFVSPVWLGAVVLFLFALRETSGQSRWVSIPVFLMLATWIALDESGYLYLPSIINLALLANFGLSLKKPKSMIERFAEKTNPDLPPAARVYCRVVTSLWCIFFIVNGSIALGLALKGDVERWALYTGCWSYFIMGGLFALEFIVRTLIKPRLDRSRVEPSGSSTT
jgi:uncharacterized membrane protein